MHENCGAYAISDPVAEEKTQTQHLAAISQQLRHEFPDLQVKGLIVTGVPTGNLNLKIIQ